MPSVVHRAGGRSKQRPYTPSPCLSAVSTASDRFTPSTRRDPMAAKPNLLHYADSESDADMCYATRFFAP
ncbi:MAG: hypothetical protein ACYTDX_04230, partial [Planctomycetota bacterium]